jgi:hypothetical protein
LQFCGQQNESANTGLGGWMTGLQEFIPGWLDEVKQYEGFICVALAGG